VELDLLIQTVDARPADVLADAVAAEEAGFRGVWVWDHLSGASTWGKWNLECWTMLSAIAARTERVMLGSMVMNVANRDAGTTAVAAATLQELSNGRLLIGLGAGAGPKDPYIQDQLDLGRPPGTDPQRRAAVSETISRMSAVWREEGRTFLQPDPPPPIFLGCFGPKMVAIAAEQADGLDVPLDGYRGGPVMEELIALAREQRAATDRGPMLTIAHASPRSQFDDERWLPGAPDRRRAQAADLDRFVLVATPPAAQSIRRLDPSFFSQDG
jgi:alkanesulfonate monooxygenase SsuD/methylene tetrahydromethanopterin reductase-like flavin-dependent oxidoreductase (luciferase family)